MKHMLVYSFIGQVGYVIIGVIVGDSNGGYASMITYMLFYISMNLFLIWIYYPIKDQCNTHRSNILRVEDSAFPCKCECTWLNVMKKMILELLFIGRQWVLGPFFDKQ